MSEQHRQVVSDHIAQPHVSGFLLTLFETIFLPILPSLLILLKPKIISNPRLLDVLKAADVAIDDIIGETP